MPELEDVGVFVERSYRADALVIEIVAVSRAHERGDLLVAEVDVERSVNRRSAFAVGELRQIENIFEGQLRKLFGDVETAALSKPVDDGSREGNGLGADAACVDVSVGAEGVRSIGFFAA